MTEITEQIQEKVVRVENHNLPQSVEQNEART